MGAILFTGAGGFIAQHAAKRMKDAGFRTIGVSRRPRNLSHFDAVYKGILSEPLEGVFAESIDTVIHCAYHSGKNDYSVNVEGTLLWAEQAEEQGIAHQIFLSSVSARADSASSYSRGKHVLEQWFTSHNHAVLRLGLVLGKGGLFRRMTGLMKRCPVLPLLDGGRSPVYVSGVKDVCEAIKMAVEGQDWAAGKTWNIFQSNPYRLREILDEFKKQAHASCLFISVPSSLALVLVRILERIPLVKLGISSNNIIGLGQSASLEWTSDYFRFGLEDTSLENLIAGTI